MGIKSNRIISIMDNNFSDKSSMDQLLYIILAVGTFIGFVFKFIIGFAMKYGKELISIFTNKSKEVPSDSLLEAVQNLKKTIQKQSDQIIEQRKKLQDQSEKLIEQQKHIERIEQILTEFESILNSLRKLKNHKTIKYIESITISLGFVDSMRPEAEDNFYDFLEEIEKLLRQSPFAGKKLSLNFLGTNAINSHANAAIARYFAKVSQEDLFRLKVIFNGNKNFDRMARNLNMLRSTTGNENVQVTILNQKNEVIE
jgi:predicted PurR-regulated permease PerM